VPHSDYYLEALKGSTTIKSSVSSLIRRHRGHWNSPWEDFLSAL